ncbi:hypothetical protein DFJ66_5076 [Saccharothrix variisporea]|uniref:DUF3800 domain-containing protein n=1 Tax=Saccharothrix variisporea TaxID=543527 RepID=A0A495XBD3_9PSEU|nr:hypothetical protein DFJ66_5076 [Saccharothrix variisporea]
MHAFVDESRRNDTYYLAAAIVQPRDLARLRSRLRGLLLPGQRELHFYREKPARRREIVSRLVEFGATVRVYEASCRRSEEIARRECLTRVTDDLVDLGAHRLVLDSREIRDELDRSTISRALAKRLESGGLVYEHMNSAGDPLLWIADIAVWCHGAGSDWARRAAPLIGEVVRLDWP